MISSVSSFIFFSLTFLTAIVAAEPPDNRDFFQYNPERTRNYPEWWSHPEQYDCTGDYFTLLQANKWTRNRSKWCQKKATGETFFFQVTDYYHSYGLSYWCASPNYPAHTEVNLLENNEKLAYFKINQTGCMTWTKVELERPLKKGLNSLHTNMLMAGPYWEGEKGKISGTHHFNLNV
ncbi:hypothetical protein LOZ53_003769 [Ophidiomyces ophidiicola]|uniref:Uncharacterized protein n=1 Tax=Ophidiomyces ophidiicola TaxID=1387563 RepID=A0ACB8UV35_9EURO|nr:uncharacterized protein LOZ57_003989 [Ophidiomyces ophidiicola]KAI1914911.1 hypothetical protein LOZ64_003686 [Ophidiomyces ophidiicola]KAI1916686.1 hypothetical protein LOZ61_000956 [Ophidiomyces ophidiicola]KAI1928036.1 hypothetical protein LOZ60_002657 [Ophidiomyces ophidiicola]KAI1945738.1 hypothetical protein LOZ57_003989 [Ophidiomyces ophidiicola]KAI1950656.1 hypothetical protein LOZ62_001921 [Ophidiomyces ophidiicola]